jgi:hypothetical protein
MEQRFKWWWNGRWGRLARRDVKVYRDGDTFRVEAVQGGVEGPIRQFPDLPESAAVDVAKSLMEESDGWQDMIKD